MDADLLLVTNGMIRQDLVALRDPGTIVPGVHIGCRPSGSPVEASVQRAQPTEKLIAIDVTLSDVPVSIERSAGMQYPVIV